MATKTHPGKYDCHARAEPHEPLFTLLGRDQLAAPLVRTWAALRAGDVAQATYYFSQAAARVTSPLYPSGRPDPAKIAEAMRCAAAMHAYHAGLPYCRVCLCTELHACRLADGPCRWADPEMTVCSNPECLAAAAAQTSTESPGVAHAR